MSNERYFMEKIIFLGTLAGALTAVTPAQAGGFFSGNIGLPGLSVNIGAVPPPVYVRSVPFCVLPPPMYAPPLVVVAPPPVFVRPLRFHGPPRFVVARPPAVVYRPYRHYVAGPPYCR